MKNIIHSVLSLILIVSVSSSAAPLIVNEYNAVGSTKYLDGEVYSDAGTNGVLEVDAYFSTVDPARMDGRFQGNGGNWIELVVVRDHLDIRGWKLKWAEVGDTETVTNGNDIWFGSSSVPQGTITFSSTAEVWSDLRAGTILTISEPNEIGIDTDDYGYADKNFTVIDPFYLDFYLDLGTDLSWDPYPTDPNDQDWWMHVSTMEEAGYGAAARVTTVTNISGDGPGNFSVGNDDWQVTITDAADEVMFGPVGEDVSGWGGSGLNSREAARMEADPSDTSSAGEFDDANNSSFGLPNRWGNPVEVTQNFARLRSWLYPPSTCAEVRAMGYVLEYDLNGDCIVNLADLMPVIADNWLACIVPGDASCSEPWN